MSSFSYLIIGCGHFGARAVEKLHKKDPLPKIIAVDKDKEAIKKVSLLPVETVVCDGLFYLNHFFSEDQSTNYIVPTVPFHLAFEFILSQLKPWGARRKKVPPLSGMPNPEVSRKGDLYTTLADFLCPEDCPGPAQYCPVTKKKHPKPLYEILSDLKGPFESSVVRSRQLEPGVGGFQFMELVDLLKYVKRIGRSKHPILISTASDCHGVTSAMSFAPDAGVGE
jgi:hypothetical protein